MYWPQRRWPLTPVSSPLRGRVLSAGGSPNAGSGRTSCIVRTSRSRSLRRVGRCRPNVVRSNGCAAVLGLSSDTRIKALGTLARVRGQATPFGVRVGRNARALASRETVGEKAVTAGCWDYMWPSRRRWARDRLVRRRNCNQIRWIGKGRSQSVGGAEDAMNSGIGLKIGTLDMASRDGMSIQ
jgi:hypothetical protein